MIGTRLSDDVALGRRFENEQEFRAWENEVTVRRNKNPARYKTLFASAETAARNIVAAMKRHNGDKNTQQAFVEGMQYGYHANSGWGEPEGSRASSSKMASLLGKCKLSGRHEDVASWKQSLSNEKMRSAGMSGYSAGANLAKSAQSATTTEEELADYFTVFSLEYTALDEQQTHIGDLLTDLHESDNDATVVLSQSNEFEQRVRDVVDKLVVFFKTHTLEEYQAFLRGFNQGYTEAPSSSSSSKRTTAASSSSDKRARVESLYEDIRQSETIDHDPFEVSETILLGQSLGIKFYQTAVVENKELALKLLSRYYDEAMERYTQLQRFPIFAKTNSALWPIFSSSTINLLAPALDEEFDAVFPQKVNTIGNDAYRDDFEEPVLPTQMHNRMDIFKKIFASAYGTQSLLQNDADVVQLVQMIMNNTLGVEIKNTIPIAPEYIGLVNEHLLTTATSPFDGVYVPSATQREMDTIRAYDFFTRSAVLLLEQSNRDVAALLFTPLLVNTMANYVDRTTSLRRILKLFPLRQPLDGAIYAFLNRHVKQMNERWLDARIAITKAVMFSRNFVDTIDDHAASDVAFYLNVPEAQTKHALVPKIAERYGNDVVTDISHSEYKKIVMEMGRDSYLRTSTRSLFNWLLINNQPYWPEDLCAMQSVIHDVVMLRHLQSEMEQRVAMVKSVLFFHEQGRFLRWDLTDFLAQREKEIDNASDNVTFSNTTRQYIQSLESSPNTDYVSESSSSAFIAPITPTGYSPLVKNVVGFASETVTDDSSDMERTEEYEAQLRVAPPKKAAFGNFSMSPTSSWNDQMFGADALAPISVSDDQVSARIGARVASSSSRSSARLRARQRGVVLRDITALEAKYPDAHSEMHFIGAYHGHAFGPKLGAAAYSRKDKKTVSMDATRTSVRAMVADCIGEMYPGGGASIGDDLADDGAPLEPPPEQLYDLDMDVTVNYRPNLAGHDREKPHGIFFYLSHSFSPSAPVFVSAEEAMAGKRLVLKYKARYEEITGHALFNVDSYAKTMDVCEDACVNQAGFASTRLADLATKRSATFTLRVPNSDRRLPKGDLMLTLHSVSMPVRQHSTVSSSSMLSTEQEKSQRLINLYIDSNREFYRKHPNVAQSVQNITVFEYASRKGVIPGSMFDSFKLAPTHERYFIQALSYVLRRRRPDIDVPIDDWMRLDAKTKVCVLMDVLRLYVNYCTYIRDMVDNNTEDRRWDASVIELIESFDYIRQRDAGDCEDFTREILQAVMELKYNMRDSQSPAVQELRRIADGFIFASVLCGVSREAMSLSELSTGRVNLHGHECAVAIPNYIFFEALRRYDPEHAIFDLYSEEEQNAGQGEQVYMLEGTGCLFPEPRTKGEVFKRVDKEFQRATTLSKHAEMVVFYHPERDDAFYKQMITILTPEFFLRTGHLGFEFLMCSRTKDGLKRGVPFSQLIDIHKHAEIEIVPAPVMSPEVFRASSRLDDDNFPPISLEPGTVTTEMRAVCAELTTGRPAEGQDFFQFHVKFSHMNTEYIEGIKRFAAQHRLQVLCLAEPVKTSFSTGENIGGYAILLF